MEENLPCQSCTAVRQTCMSSRVCELVRACTCVYVSISVQAYVYLYNRVLYPWKTFLNYQLDCLIAAK